MRMTNKNTNMIAFGILMKLKTWKNLRRIKMNGTRLRCKIKEIIDRMIYMYKKKNL